ncbi:PilZ domain-containing protein [Bradyrhizobium sp. SYSU BS000235]|uniref:PilZ domain-containing protein n=1 Tax=Bradyrhizobium sp. SYSU BS000235 TaxID=3411332 RepID=UPI003C723C47
MAVFKRESRKARHRTQHDAWVTLDGGFAKRNCTILDLSAGGARLQLSDSGLTASKLDLALSKDVRKTTRCRVVWRKGAIIGVEFLTRT